MSVATPWELDTYIPRESVIQMNCTGEKSQALRWAITLPGHPTPDQFLYPEHIARLNSHNFYKMPEVEHEMGKTIQLLINNTERTNGTRIQCVDIGSAMTINETTLTVYGKLPS